MYMRDKVCSGNVEAHYHNLYGVYQYLLYI
jgi:hypothetical protein